MKPAREWRSQLEGVTPAKSPISPYSLFLHVFMKKRSQNIVVSFEHVTE